MAAAASHWLCMWHADPDIRIMVPIGICFADIQANSNNCQQTQSAKANANPAELWGFWASAHGDQQ